MTHTLTTEQLRARAKFWREKAVEAKWESVRIAQDMLLNADAFEELAANREAQPVAYLKKPIIDSEQFDSVDPEIILHPNTPEGWYSEYMAVFTAPPAPVVNSELTRAPVVPPEITACRAAMLAQPVSQGCKLNSPVIPDGWKLVPVEPTCSMNTAGGKAIKSVEYQSDIARTAYKAMLAAAPDGGDDA